MTKNHTSLQVAIDKVAKTGAVTTPCLRKKGVGGGVPPEMKNVQPDELKTVICPPVSLLPLPPLYPPVWVWKALW